MCNVGGRGVGVGKRWYRVSYKNITMRDVRDCNE